MAYYDDSFIDVLRYKVSQEMDRAENRYKPSNILRAFLENRDFLIPGSELERAMQTKTAEDQTVYMNILNRQSISTGSARAYDHSGNNNASTKEAVSFITKTADYQYRLKESNGNIFSSAEAQAKQFLSAVMQLHEDFETYLASWLHTNRTQEVENTTAPGGTWDDNNYRFNIANADEDRYYQRMRGWLRRQYMNGMLYYFGDEYSVQQAEYLINQGSGNSENWGWSLNNVMPIVGHDITPGEGLDAVGFVVPAGLFGAINWIPKQNREGFGKPTDNGGGYYSLPDPFGLPITYAIHERAAGADNDGTGSETQDINFNVEVSTDFGFVVAPESTANKSVIHLVGLLDS